MKDIGEERRNGGFMKMKSSVLVVLLLAIILFGTGCARTVKYYDSKTEECDKTKYKCVDIRKIK